METFLCERDGQLPKSVVTHPDDQAKLASGSYPWLIHDESGASYHHVATTDTGVWIYRKTGWN